MKNGKKPLTPKQRALKEIERNGISLKSLRGIQMHEKANFQDMITVKYFKLGDEEILSHSRLGKAINVLKNARGVAPRKSAPKKEVIYL